MTPKTLTATLVALLAGATMATAQTEPALDADGDDIVTLSEAQAAMPEMTEDDFAALDTNADGVLDAEEVAMALDIGTLPKKSETES